MGRGQSPDTVSSGGSEGLVDRSTGLSAKGARQVARRKARVDRRYARAQKNEEVPFPAPFGPNVEWERQLKTCTFGFPGQFGQFSAADMQQMHAQEINEHDVLLPFYGCITAPVGGKDKKHDNSTGLRESKTRKEVLCRVWFNATKLLTAETLLEGCALPKAVYTQYNTSSFNEALRVWTGKGSNPSAGYRYKVWILPDGAEAQAGWPDAKSHTQSLGWLWDNRTKPELWAKSGSYTGECYSRPPASQYHRTLTPVLMYCRLSGGHHCCPAQARGTGCKREARPGESKQTTTSG